MATLGVSKKEDANKYKFWVRPYDNGNNRIEEGYIDGSVGEFEILREVEERFEMQDSDWRDWRDCGNAYVRWCRFADRLAMVFRPGFH